MEKNITWQASAALDYKHSSNWHLTLILVALILIGLCIWQQQWVTIGLIVIIVVTIFVTENHESPTLTYVLTEKGLGISEKFKEFDKFRAFGMCHDGDFWSLVLIPTSRFGTEITAYIPDNKKDEIEEFIANYLPKKDINSSFIDKINKKIQL